MSWYKISKLINKDLRPENYLITKCQSCDRYETENLINPEEPIWKTPQEMDAEEIQEFNKSKNNKKTRISHGLCPYCEIYLLKDLEENEERMRARAI